jgi:hypothetical protein
LHSHTLYSRESLGFLSSWAQGSGPLGWFLQWQIERYRSYWGIELDLSRAWWTPPLDALQALQLEAGQISTLGLNPLVSLTDHDTLDAHAALQAEGHLAPVSVEWTVPLKHTWLHLGIHNLPTSSACDAMQQLAGYTASPEESLLEELLTALHELPDVLIVLNHPLWDEKGIGREAHERVVHEFLQRHSSFIHAFEFNGLRPHQENLLTLELARHWLKPVVAGGDRHTFEANAVINLTRCARFSDFVSEVRQDGLSEILLLPHYQDSHVCRILQNLNHVLQAQAAHPLGWRQWTDRVFLPSADGRAVALSALCGDRLPAPLSALAPLAGLAVLVTSLRKALWSPQAGSNGSLRRPAPAAAP